MNKKGGSWAFYLILNSCCVSAKRVAWLVANSPKLAIAGLWKLMMAVWSHASFKRVVGTPR